jgi:hypothetical protein
MDTQEIDTMLKNRGVAFMPPSDEIVGFARENWGQAYLTALAIIDKFVLYVQEWNSKDLSIPNEHDTIDKPLDTVSSCCHADYQVGGDEGTYYYICGKCGRPCDAIPTSEKK